MLRIMAVERQDGGTSLIDLLDRVLDKGIVVDARVSVPFVDTDGIADEEYVLVIEQYDVIDEDDDFED